MSLGKVVLSLSWLDVHSEGRETSRGKSDEEDEISHSSSSPATGVWTEVRPWPLPPPADPRSAVVHALKRSSGPKAPHSGSLQLLLRQALNPQPVAQPFGSCYTTHITETQPPVLPAALFTVAKRRKPPRRPVGEWIGAVRSARAMTPFLGRTKKDVLIPGAMCGRALNTSC